MEPFALVVGDVGSSTAQYLLCVEGNTIFEGKSFIEIIFDVVGTYYNINLCYPKTLLSILFFFHYYIFQIDKALPKKMPQSLANFIRYTHHIMYTHHFTLFCNAIKYGKV